MSDTKLTAEESCRQVLKSIADACVDLFCGAGGLTHGLIAAGVPVVAGVDLDEACRHPYQANNPGATFYARAGATGSGGRALRGRDD
ncbi:MAG: DNA cytosine methyltransferase [Myxococcales bacterium]|nr:DNA cytosine methyltransferase [Myxococcales bacterium]